MKDGNPFKEALDKIKEIDLKNDNVRFLFFVHLELCDKRGLKISINAAKENIDAIREFSEETKDLRYNSNLIESIKEMISSTLNCGSIETLNGENKNLH